MPEKKKIKKRRYRLIVLANIDEYRAIKSMARNAKKKTGPWMRNVLLEKYYEVI